MIINGKSGCNHVTFVSYSGRYPNLCCGTLVLNIDGELITFDYLSNKADSKKVFPSFWHSGGSTGFAGPGYENPYTETNEWNICVEELPEKYRQYASEIDEVFNENVPFGCCGGCI